MDRLESPSEMRIETSATRLEIAGVVLRFASQESGGPVVVVLIILLSLAALPLSLMSSQFAHWGGGVTLVSLPLFGAYIAARFAWIIGRYVRGHQHRLAWYRFSEAGFEVRTAYGDGSFMWNTVSVLERCGDWFALVLGPVTHLIPTAAFAPDQLEAFTKLVAAKTRFATTPRRWGSPLGLMIGFLFFLPLALTPRLFTPEPGQGGEQRIRNGRRELAGMPSPMEGQFLLVSWTAVGPHASADTSWLQSTRGKGFYFSRNSMGNDVVWVHWPRTCSSARYLAVSDATITDSQRARIEERDGQRVEVRCERQPDTGPLVFQLMNDQMTSGHSRLLHVRDGWALSFEWTP